jgi:large subunit ribosomal protein L21
MYSRGQLPYTSISASSLRVGNGKAESMFAVIKSGGRQYKVAVGQTLEVNRLLVEDGAQVKFEEVLLISDADRSTVGTPLVDNAVVLATATRQSRGEKLIVFKYKSKKRQRHRRGHRQELTVLTIDDIVANGISLVTGEAPQDRQAPIEEEVAEPEAVTETEAETPAAETEAVPEVQTEKKTTRRRRTAKVEDSEAQAGESSKSSESRTEE